MVVRLDLTRENFPPNYQYEIEENSENFTLNRVDIRSKEHLDMRLSEFRKSSGTGWILRDSLGNPQRFVLSRTYVCQHSSHGKSRKAKG